MSSVHLPYLFTVIVVTIIAGIVLDALGSKPNIGGYALGLGFGWLLRSIVDR